MLKFLNSVVIAAALVIGSTAGANAATTFYFRFDNSGGGPDGTIGSPIVGSGTFVSPVDLAPGVYGLDSLTGYTFAAQVDGASFTEADLLTPSSGVSVGITQVAGGERLVFTETPGDPGADGGPFGGAADFGNANGLLTFEPTYAGGNTLYYGGASLAGSFGNYLALSAPEPASWALLLVGFGGLGAALRRRTAGAARV
jgi:hypothetical protein